jgi:ABC-2 type transport system permease protein
MSPDHAPRWWTRSIYGRALHDERRALVGWSIGIAATIILELALYPTVRNNDMSKLIDSYPDSVKQLFGLADFATGTGYVRAELFSFVLPLMVVLFGVLWGSDAIAGEEDRGTLDLVLANPITRRRVVAEKAAALLTGLAMVCAAMTVALVVGDAAFSVGVPVARLVAAALMTFVLAATFAFLGLALGAATGHRGAARGLGAALAVAAYLLSALAPLASWLGPWRRLSPWYHALGVDPLGGGIPLDHLALLCVVVALLALAAAEAFDRRDLAV